MADDRIRAVLVEDDPRAAGQYAHWTPDRWSVSVVSSAEAALEAVDGDTDVVVVGTDLPDEPAYRLVGTIRSQGFDSQVVVAGVGDEPQDWGVHGVDGVVPAPVEREPFREALAQLADRVAYDRRLQKYYSLVSERAVMEARHSSGELADSEEYQRLVERADELNRQVDEFLDDIAAVDDYGSVFRGFFPGRGVEQ
jgi:DNA-binding NtrC family response regulator